MIQTFAVFMFVGILTLSGCMKVNRNTVVLGKTSFEELRKIKGEPIKTEMLVDRPQAETAVYSPNISYQIESKKVVARVRSPEGQEDSLQYWLHAWKAYDLKLGELKQTKEVHGENLYQLSASEISTLVIYDRQADRVLYVVDYAAP